MKGMPTKKKGEENQQGRLAEFSNSAGMEPEEVRENEGKLSRKCLRIEVPRRVQSG